MRGLFPAATDALLEERVVLVVSELVTNVVRHTHSGGTLDAWKATSSVMLRVEVADHERAAPERREPSDAGGRGMSIVDRICDSWGVAACVDGKVVWAELSASEISAPRSAEPAGC